MTKTLKADFVIVGAGFAGLTAAWRLVNAKPPASVIVLEARTRVGGRVWTIPWRNDAGEEAWLDLGGTWFGPGQQYSYDVANELKIPTYPTYNGGDSLVVLDSGQVLRKPKSIPLGDLFPAAEGALLLAELEAMATQVPLHAPWEASRAREWDRQTFAGWIASKTKDDSLALTGIALNTIFMSLFCIDPAELSLLDALVLVHSNGGFTHLMSAQGGDQQDRIVGGMQSIVNALHEKLGDAVHLGEPVRKIAQDATGVTVTSNTLTVRAQRAIVTIPPPLANFVEYDPPLPADRVQLQQREALGSVLKIVTIYDDAFWRKDDLSGQSFAVTDPVGATYDGCTTKDKPGLLISFVFGPNARAFGRMTKSARKSAIVESLVKRFGPAAGDLRDYHEIEWADEVWTRGGIFAHFPTGVWTNYGQLLKQPVGLVHWAGTETSTDFHGSINGAIESGQRAAREVLDATRASD